MSDLLPVRALRGLAIRPPPRPTTVSLGLSSRRGAEGLASRPSFYQGTLFLTLASTHIYCRTLLGPTRGPASMFQDLGQTWRVIRTAATHTCVSLQIYLANVGKYRMFELLFCCAHTQIQLIRWCTCAYAWNRTPQRGPRNQSATEQSHIHTSREPLDLSLDTFEARYLQKRMDDIMKEASLYNQLLGISRSKDFSSYRSNDFPCSIPASGWSSIFILALTRAL